MTQKPITFSQVLRQAARTPNLDGKVLSWLRRKLGISVHNCRVKNEWPLPDPSAIPRPEYYVLREEKIEDAIVFWMDQYRRQNISGPVTEEATKMVLNQVRTCLRRRFAELTHVVSITEEEARRYDPIVFNVASEDKVKDFERLHHHGVIDDEEYCLFLAVCQKTSIVDAAKLIDMNDATARQILGRAVVRLQAHIASIDAGILPKPRPTNKQRSPRTKKDEDTLMNAIRHILGHAAPKKK